LAICGNDINVAKLADEFRVVVAQGMFAEAGPEHHLLTRDSGQKIRLPKDQANWPSHIHIAWHRNKKFRGT
jgi:plasmid stability protein